MQQEQSVDLTGGASSPAAGIRHNKFAARFIRATAVAYLTLVVAASVLLRTQGDRSGWITFVLLFGPRWLFLLPLIAFIPVAWFRYRRALWIFAVSVVVELFVLMGLQVHASVSASKAGACRIRVMTCNLHRLQVDPGALSNLIAAENPDVVALQEWSSRHSDQLFKQGNWTVLRDGELCVASRFPIHRKEDLVKGSLAAPGAAVCYEIATPQVSFACINLHLASPHNAFDAVLHHDVRGAIDVEKNSALRRQQSRVIADFASTLHLPVLMMGDFNTPPESPIFRDAWANFDDAFSQAGNGFGFTYYARLTAVRIDHLLAGPGLRCVRCSVGPDVKSPHRPLIADFQFIAPHN